MKPLFGREIEMKQLIELKQKKTASLVVLWGRRRVGKSRLADEFGKSFKRYYSFQGLGPRKGQTNQDQLNYFSEKLSEYFDLPKFKITSWSEAFKVLSKQTIGHDCCILLDEISWLGQKDKDFAGKLKDIWDTQLSQNNKLILILCGSVSSWIQENILEKTDFIGRISLGIQIEQLPLNFANLFWPSAKINKIGDDEKLKALLLTGGVPKYLEEIASKIPVDQQIKSKCFNRNGFFFQEFEKIFSDIFARRAETEKQIVKTLLTQRMTASEIAVKSKKALNGKLTKAINYLVISGFVQEDYIYKLTGEPSDKVYYRIKDNYLRFYLKLIEPFSKAILTGLSPVKKMENLEGWDVFKGFQFENLILSSLEKIFLELSIDTNDVIAASPYIQKKNSRIKKGCQIDLLIQVRKNVYYVCEIKSGNINKNVIKEVNDKIDAIKWPKRATIKSILICFQIDGDLKELLEEDFHKVITFSELLS